MKYRMQRGNYKDFEIYEQNKRAPRAYFIPYGDEEVLRATPMARQRYTSDLVRVLSGAWDFRYYADARELPKELDTEEMVFDQVQVPSTWQRTGYEPPVYLNCPYEFESPMPEMPEQVPCGIYRKLFTLEETHNRSFLLSFLGAAACLDVFLNGYHVGYSEGAHNTAEFDISGMAAPGENELLVAVHKWSTGTYLECQDMFRESGIFRDVLLYDLPKTYLTDVFAKPQRLPDGGYRLQVTAEVLGECGGWSLEFAIDGLEASFSGAAKERVSFTLDLPEVIEWNAEQPKLYQAWLRLKKDGALSQTVNLPIGFKTVQIKKNIFLFNGKKIKFKGVNHHDTDPVTGYCMRYEDYLKDLTLMKALNVNAIRTAHYPPDPHLLMLADEMGFYVVDEADIETHGAEFPPHNDFHLVSHDKRWIPRYLDRVKRMLFRDRNHACVTMWSLGNEAGGHHCQDACYAFLHAVHPEIPVHYESVVHTPVYAYDVYSEMYTPHAKLERIGKQKEDERFRGKPFFLCEYAHAMGVGPGGLAEYGDLFLAYETLMGGCIWEWADHAVDHGEGAALRYTYGGDHGERKHDGNFCVDGLVYPDRRPHTGAYAMKNVYRPIRAAAKGGGRFVFTNTNRFKSAYGIHVEWLLDENGAPKASGSFALACEAEQSEEVQLWLDEFAPQTDVHILFRYLDGAGEEIAAEQITLQECYVPEELPAGTQLSLTEDAEQYIIRTQGASLRFGKASAALESYQQPEGQELLCGASLVPNLLRAKLDNDKCLERRLEETGLDQM
ncbi:MAG: hypothetical protein LBQ33_01805, partial [Oscillospiraceae bacterium]|nr:hypothetical protein [Oscillospiraceae bacterium]